MSSKLCNILCWNVCGLNSDDKCLAMRSKVDESGYVIACLQETKNQYFDHSFICKICPKMFDKFEFIPSLGAFGGLVILWCSAIFCLPL